jgi:hypothetical protein
MAFRPVLLERIDPWAGPFLTYWPLGLVSFERNGPSGRSFFNVLALRASPFESNGPSFWSVLNALALRIGAFEPNGLPSRYLSSNNLNICILLTFRLLKRNWFSAQRAAGQFLEPIFDNF